MGRAILFYFFMNGAIMMASFVISLFFARFYRDGTDRFFLLFALAFALLGIERLVLLWLGHGMSESFSGVYLLRCSAFLLIIFAVVDKNKR